VVPRVLPQYLFPWLRVFASLASPIPVDWLATPNATSNFVLPPAHSPPIYSYISACLSFVLTAQAQIPVTHSSRRPSMTFYSLSFSDLSWPATTARLLAFTSSAGPTTIPGFYSSCPGLELLLLSYQFLSITELIGWISATSDYR